MTVKKMVNSNIFKLVFFYNTMYYINNILSYILFYSNITNKNIFKLLYFYNIMYYINILVYLIIILYK